MSDIIIGREKELVDIKGIFSSNQAEFLAIYGRRRVGKTYLVETFFKNQNCFYFSMTGKHRGNLSEQLNIFKESVEQYLYPNTGIQIQAPTSWHNALKILTTHIDQLPKNQKVVLFFDELPWLSTPKSEFIDNLEYYWNNHWSKNKKIKLIVCGSAAGWMLENLIHDTGGLHNRITHSMRVQPFKLHEVEAYLAYRKLNLSQTHITNVYMCTGGVPHYLNQIKKGRSATEIVDQLCFQKGAFLRTEFDKLYRSLFKRHENHIQLIKKIAKYPYGLSRSDLIDDKKFSSGGTLHKHLNELEEAGFIIKFLPFGKEEKGIYYKVIDEYSLFYLRFIEPFNKKFPTELDDIKGYWQTQKQTALYKAWSGLAFEALVYKHVAQVRSALSLPASALPGTWQYSRKKEHSLPGARIDLLFDRQDDAISICEIRYYAEPLKLTKTQADNLKQKTDVFQKVTKTKKQLFMIIISPHGLTDNKYSGLISQSVTLNDLFKK